MTVTHVGDGAQSSSATLTGAYPALPAALAAGDLMLCTVLGFDNAVGTPVVVTPTGWNLIATKWVPTNTLHRHLYYSMWWKMASTSEVPELWTFPASLRAGYPFHWNIMIKAFRGLPYPGLVSDVTSDAALVTTTPAIPAGPTLTQTGFMVCGSASDQSNQTFDTANGYTLDIEPVSSIATLSSGHAFLDLVPPGVAPVPRWQMAVPAGGRAWASINFAFGSLPPTQPGWRHGRHIIGAQGGWG